MHTSGGHAVGPNAIIQTARAIQAVKDLATVHQVFETAGLARYLTSPPSRMVPEDDAMVLFDAVRRQLSAPEADAVLADAGRRTARYIIAHRIPRPIAHLLRLVPSEVGARILIKAIERHAWTFAGSGSVRIQRGRSVALSITDNPLATPGCPWHTATLQELFRGLVSRPTRVYHSACCARGDSLCRFDFDLSGHQPRAMDFR